MTVPSPTTKPLMVRSLAQQGVSNHEAQSVRVHKIWASSFETPAFGGLLRMRSGRRMLGQGRQ